MNESRLLELIEYRMGKTHNNVALAREILAEVSRPESGSVGSVEALEKVRAELVKMVTFKADERNPLWFDVARAQRHQAERGLAILSAYIINANALLSTAHRGDVDIPDFGSESLAFWAFEEGYQTWATDHAAVLRNLILWLRKYRSNPTPLQPKEVSREEMTQNITEMIDHWKANTDMDTRDLVDGIMANVKALSTAHRGEGNRNRCPECYGEPEGIRCSLCKAEPAPVQPRGEVDWEYFKGTLMDAWGTVFKGRGGMFNDFFSVLKVQSKDLVSPTCKSQGVDGKMGIDDALGRAQREYAKTLNPNHSQLGCFCDGWHWRESLHLSPAPGVAEAVEWISLAREGVKLLNSDAAVQVTVLQDLSAALSSLGVKP